MAMILFGLYFILCAIFLTNSSDSTGRFFNLTIEYGVYKTEAVIVFFVVGLLLLWYGYKYELKKSEKEERKKQQEMSKKGPE